jgi:two-component system cell cycle response regulator PopA
MESVMVFTAQILILAKDKGAVFRAADQLADKGMPTILAETDEAALIAAKDMNVDAVLIDALDRDPEQVEALAKQLIADCAPRPLPVIVVSDQISQATSPVFSSVLFPPVHPAQLVARVQSALRLAIMEEEVQLRQETMRGLGHESKHGLLDAEQEGGPISVLFTGGATPQFIAIKNALEKAGAEVTAALTSFTAFDYLHEKTFDVILLNVLKDQEPAFTIASAMRRNTKLFHVPAVMLVNPAKFEAVDEAFARGASDLINPDNGPEVARQRILNLAHERRRREQVKRAFESVRNTAVIEPESGLFTPAFFAQHLARTTGQARLINRPLSLTVIRAIPPQGIKESFVEAARRQFGGMLRHLVRAEDMAARIDTGVFAVLMPGASEQPARAAAKRIEGVVECTAFESGDMEKPFQLELEVEVLELKPRETPDHLLERAISS